MLLLTALVHHMRIQRSQKSEAERAQQLNRENEEQALAPLLAKMLSANPKLMIEVAIEMTKMTQSEIKEQSSDKGTSSLLSEGRNRSESAPAFNLSAGNALTGALAKTSLIAAQPSFEAKRLI